MSREMRNNAKYCKSNNSCFRCLSTLILFLDDEKYDDYRRWIIMDNTPCLYWMSSKRNWLTLIANHAANSNNSTCGCYFVIKIFSTLSFNFYATFREYVNFKALLHRRSLRDARLNYNQKVLTCQASKKLFVSHIKDKNLAFGLLLVYFTMTCGKLQLLKQRH